VFGLKLATIPGTQKAAPKDGLIHCHEL